MIGPRSNN